jgi:hypothetical protein
VDIYDLTNAVDKGTQPTQTGLLTKVQDVAVGTDLSRRLLSPEDWFYSKLFRRLLY